MARLRRTEVGLSEAELIVTRTALDELRDRIYVLEAAIEDVERDREAAAGEQDLAEALEWLLQAARPVIHAQLDVTAIMGGAGRAWLRRPGGFAHNRRRTPQPRPRTR